MKGIPSQQEISGILFDEKACKEWLVKEGIILQTRICDTCQKSMVLNELRESYRHNCLRKKKEMSMWKNTMFSRTHLKPNQVINLLYLWLLQTSHTAMMASGKHTNRTVTALIRDANQMVSNMLDENDTYIGGEDVIVEIDESKLSKRKYNRGHPVEGVWVIGGVERTLERKMFAVPVIRRDADTISQIIEKHVRPGSVIHTDCWRGYSYLDSSTIHKHKTVNHSKYFKDPITSVHTNTIEGTWSSIKARIAKRYRCETGIQDHLAVFIWRRQNELTLWSALITALKDYHWLE